MAFPTSPTDGQTAVVNNITYVYSSASNAWTRTATGFVNLSASANISAGGNVIGGNILTSGIVSALGNITGNYFIGNGSQLTGITANSIVGSYSNSNVLAYLSTGFNGNIIPSANATYSLGNLTNQWQHLYVSNTSIYIGGVQLTGNATTLTYGGNALVSQNANGNVSLGNISSTGFVSATGNLIGGNVTTVGLVSATGNVTGNYILGNGALLTGVVTTVSNVTNGNSNVNIAAAAANVTVSVSGVGNVAVFAPTGEYVTGVISASGNITGGNLSGTLVTGTLTTAAQPNVTSLGTLTSLSVTGNTTGGNFTTSGTLSVGGIVLSGNTIVGAGPTLTIDPNGLGGTDGNVVITGNLTVNGTTTTINSNIVTINDLQITVANNAANSTQANNGGIGVGPVGAEYATLLYNTASNVWVSSLGISAVGSLTTGAGITATGNVGGGNILTAGVMSSTGNAIHGNILTAGLISATGNITTAGFFVGTFAGSISGNVTAAGANTQIQFNSSGNLAATAGLTFNTVGNVLSVTGNVVGANLLTAGLISATGTITSAANVIGGNITTVGLVSATGTVTGSSILGTIVSASGNVIGGNITTAGLVTATGNVTGGNLLTAGIMSSAGNAIHGNVLTGGLISATANITSAANIIQTGTGNINGYNGYFSNNLTVLGTFQSTSNITANGAGIFYGNSVSGNNALFAGVPGFTPLGSNVVLQVAGNANSYSQINFQNINGGNAATTEIVITANNGNDVAYFGDFGIAGNNYANTNPVNSLGTSVSPNDTYVYAQGNANGGGGNLIVGSNERNGVVRVIANGSNIANIVATFANGGVSVTGIVSATGNVTGGNLLSAGLASVTGNITTANYFLGNGALLSGINVAASSSKISNGGSYANIPASNANVSIGVGASSNVVAVFYDSGVNFTGPTSASGNVTGSNLLTAGLISATGTVTGSSLLGSVVSASGNVIGGNVTTVGLISATGNVTTANYFLGNGALLSGINVAASSSKISNGGSYANIPTSGGNLSIGIGTSSNVVAVFYDSGVNFTGPTSASGNVTGGNILTAGLMSSTGNAIHGNILTTGVVSATANVTGGNILTAGLISATGAITSAANVIGGNISTAGLVTATGNVTGGNILTAGLMSSTGNAIHGNILTTGVVSATANVTGGNILTAGLISATSTITSAANVTGGNITTAGLVSATGTITSAANVIGGNITTVGLVSATGTVTGSSLLGSVVSASGNITGGNLLTAGLISATSTITSAANIAGGNLLTAGLISSAGTITSTANIIGGNITTAGLVTATGNVTGGNLLTGGAVTATGNITTAGIVNTANINGASGVTITTTGNANINLYPAGTGNVVLPSGNTTYINNLALTPVQNNDAASKYYVDTMATTGISFHAPVYVSTTANLATTTGGTITYAQPNGAGNGIGATITTTGSFNLIDTANVQTANTRILVKNEGNAVLNGVYVWSNATVITRSTDTDEYGSDSANSFSINDYFFTTNGNVNAGSAFVVNAPSGTITFGTSNISFALFSSSQTYTAGNGISLAGTVINAKVDNVTTAFDGGGNIIVKTSANLVTPNIGAATGTSLSTTGTVTSGNILTGGVVSAAGNITGLSIFGTVVSASGNVTGGNILTAGLISATSTITSAANISGGNLLTVGLISATSTITSAANITGGNILTAGIMSSTGNAIHGNILTAGVVSATANIIGGNILTAGLISATSTITSAANITGGNLLTAGLISATSTITSAANIIGGNISTAGLITATGNVTGGNILTAGIMSSTGNAIHGNILTAGLISATGNVTGNFILGNGSQLTGIITSVSNVVNGGSNLNIATANANVTISVSTVGNIAVFAPTGVSVLGTVAANGNITGGNILTAGLMSSTGNATVGNILTAGLISATGTTATGINAAQFGIPNVALHATAVVTSAGNSNQSAQFAFQNFSALSNASADIAVYNNLGTDSQYFIDMGIVSSTYNGTAAGANLFNPNDGYLYVAGNSITGPVGSGANIGNLILGATNGQVIVWLGNTSTANIVTVTSNTGFAVTGIVSASGNVTGGNIVSAGIISTSGNIFGGGIRSTSSASAPSSPSVGDFWYNTTTNVQYRFTFDGTSYYWIDDYGPSTGMNGTFNAITNGTSNETVASNGNITITVGGTAIAAWTSAGLTNMQANGVGNIGNATTYFNTVFAKATSAQYADLAETYVADDSYAPGTLVIFGGADEITASTVSHDTRVAGIISTAPAYLMNSGAVGLPVALTGRVPCSVVGTIRKGDRLVASTIKGVATALDATKYLPGCIIGKALADYDSNSTGVIEVAVGRY